MNTDKKIDDKLILNQLMKIIEKVKHGDPAIIKLLREGSSIAIKSDGEVVSVNKEKTDLFQIAVEKEEEQKRKRKKEFFYKTIEKPFDCKWKWIEYDPEKHLIICSFCNHKSTKPIWEVGDKKKFYRVEYVDFLFNKTKAISICWNCFWKIEYPILQQDKHSEILIQSTKQASKTATRLSWVAIFITCVLAITSITLSIYRLLK